MLEKLQDPDWRHYPILQNEGTIGFFERLLAGILKGMSLEYSGMGGAEFQLRGQGPAEAAFRFRLENVPDCPEELAAAIEGAGETRVTISTSGSTERPKRVTHTVAALTRAVRLDDTHQRDVWGLAYHPSHIAGLQVFFQAVMNGNTIINLYGLDPAEVLPVMRDHGVTHISATPTFYRLLPHPDIPLTGVRRVTSGGEPLDLSLWKRLRDTFPRARFLNIYASTEAGTLLAARGDWFKIPKALSEHLRVHDGELQIHRSLTGELSGGNESAWYRTGDLVEITESPGDALWLRFKGRKGQEINIGGFKINPVEVETVLREHGDVRESRVYARPSSVLGSILCCDAVIARPLEEKELRAFLSERLHPYQIPRIWRFVDCMKTTRSGKRELLTKYD